MASETALPQPLPQAADITLRLLRPAMPNGEGFRHGIREHPSFCSVCLNFDWEIARDLFMVREGLDLDMVYDGVSNTTPVRDVVEAATSGCGSCVVIQACAVALSDGQFDPDSEQQMEVMYASTNKLGDTTPIVFLFDDMRTDTTVPGINALGGPAITDPSLADPAAVADLHIRLTVEDDKWRASDTRKEVLSILAANKPSAGWPLDKAVVFALGSFTTRRLESEREKSMGQLAVFLDIAKSLRTAGGKALELFAQDPKFTATDQAFLRECGVTVLQDPEGQGLVRPTVFAAAFHWGQEFDMTCQCPSLRPGLLLGVPFARFRELRGWLPERASLDANSEAWQPASVPAPPAERVRLFDEYEAQHYEVPVPAYCGQRLRTDGGPVPNIERQWYWTDTLACHFPRPDAMTGHDAEHCRWCVEGKPQVFLFPLWKSETELIEIAELENQRKETRH